jgi:hypothetical protein
MFAPRLLASPDLVPRAAAVGLAPDRSARPDVPSRPQRPHRSAPADGITQRDVRRIAQPEGAGHALGYLRGTSEVHARYIGLPTPEYRTDQLPAGSVAAGPIRKTARLPMRESPGAE